MSVEHCVSKLEVLSETLAGIAGVNVRMREPMARYTSLGVGGPADIFVLPTSPEGLREVMRISAESGGVPLLIGNGTNLIVRDGGVRGVVVLTVGGLDRIERVGDEAVIESGATLASVCSMCAHRGLSGMEFAAGIPGTLGGALIMNAGANGGEMGDITQWVDVVDLSGVVRRYQASELDFSYRRSALRNMDGAILRASLKFVPGDPESVHDDICEKMTLRCARQPVTMSSAGSIFKRPEGDYAGRLLEEAGAKGMCVGGAAVSDKHANFLVNCGDATARDVLDLIARVRDMVFDKSGVMLEPEVHVVGEDTDTTAT